MGGFNRRLSPDQVATLRHEYANGLSSEEIANRHDLYQSIVHRAVTGRTYGDIPNAVTERLILGRSCELCGGPMQPTAHANAKYCGSRCKYRASVVLTYGIRAKEYQQLISSGKCPLCQRNIKKWHIDHNHQTNETYGVVCSDCNTRLLAGSRHDVGIAQRLVEFLSNPPVRQLDGLPRFITNARRNWNAKHGPRRSRRGIAMMAAKKVKGDN